jgi:acyl-coenzyme A synthetase/AMP-(fatty) acid ligase
MFLNQCTNSLSLRKNVITDGKLICQYDEILRVFESLQKVFTERSIESEDCLALECDNSVPSALSLLYLLEKGYSFLLLPKEEKISQQSDSKQSIPRFCRYRIIAESLTEDRSAVSLEHPDRFLQIAENEQWICKSQGGNNADPKLYMRTSGSTGTPKIAVHSHTKLWENALKCVERLGIKSDDRVAIPVPIYHMYGLGAAFLPSVLVGASIDLQKGANLLRYLQREKEFNPNVVFMTPIFCETLLKGRKSSRAYRLTVAAGDRIREDTFARYESQFGPLVKLYGSTEMGAIAAASPDETHQVRAKTVGLPMSDVQICVEEGKVESTDEMKGVGELWCKREYGFDGYIDVEGNPINQSQDINGFRTKDLGRIGSDGRVEVLGRCDYSVNRDGLLVLFSDVEKAIETIDGIETVVVVSQGESQRGKGLVAYCVLAKGTTISEADIRASCFNILPKRAIPDRLLIVNSLPMLPNGKVDRQKLIGMGDKADVMNLVRS